MDHAGFERQVDRLAAYFRSGKKLTNDQKTEWWEQLCRCDLEDITRAVDALIAEGTVGRLPTIQQMASATAHARRLRQPPAREFTLDEVPASPGFAADAKVNLMRLWGSVRNSRGKLLPQFRGDPDKGLTPHQQALGNLFALADRHQVDITKWAYLPDGDYSKLRAYGRCKAHMDAPLRVPAPSASDLELMNRWWVQHVFQPTVEFNLDRGME